MSFSLAEIHLARSLKEEQRLSFLALKAICHVEAKELDGFSSYFLRTVLFWTCEKNPRELWRADNLGKTFLILVDELISCLKNGLIFNYFIPERNMICTIHKDRVLQWVKKLEEVRHNPMAFILRFHDIYKPLNGLKISLSEEKAVRDADRYQKGLRLVGNDTSTDLDNKELFAAAMFEIAFLYTVEGKFLDLMPLAADFKSLRDPLNGTMTIEVTPLNGHVDQVVQLIEFMEALIQHFTEGNRSDYSQRLMVMIQTNLARLCHEVSRVSEAVTQKVQYLDHAKKTFHVVSISIHCDPSSALCLANFLRTEGQFEEAIAVLEVTKDYLKHWREWCSFVVFNKFTSHAVDEYLTQEFHARQEIEYWVITFTLYLLIACCIESGQVSRARDLMVEMFRARDLSEKEFSDADSCVLMGYCYLMLGDVEEAIRVFTSGGSPTWSTNRKFHICYSELAF